MAASGFFLAAGHVRQFDIGLLTALLSGMALVIGSACVFNNLLDESIDKKMARTKQRALVVGRVSRPAALTYGSLLGAAGLAILIIFTNSRVVWLNLAALFGYVVIYGWAKRHSVHGTLVGSLPGAVPPVAGYAAVSQLDSAAFLLFIILICWQMAHFYAIALYRFNDYMSAGLPVMPVRYGMEATRYQIIIYVILLAGACGGLTAAGYDGYVFLVASLILCLGWLGRGINHYALTDKKWGRLMFLFSLIVLTGLSLLIPLGTFLP